MKVRISKTLHVTQLQKIRDTIYFFSFPFQTQPCAFAHQTCVRIHETFFELIFSYKAIELFWSLLYESNLHVNNKVIPHLFVCLICSFLERSFEKELQELGKESFLSE